MRFFLPPCDVGLFSRSYGVYSYTTVLYCRVPSRVVYFADFLFFIMSVPLSIFFLKLKWWERFMWVNDLFFCCFCFFLKNGQTTSGGTSPLQINKFFSLHSRLMLALTVIVANPVTVVALRLFPLAGADAQTISTITVAPPGEPRDEGVSLYIALFPGWRR